MKKISCILLVDDNPNDNYYHQSVIREADASIVVKTARDGTSALEYFKNSNADAVNYPVPELIFLDLHMPGMDGFSFLDHLKQEDTASGTKPVIVVMTGSLVSENEQLAREKYAGQIKAFVHKPLSKQLFETIIHKFL